LRYISGFGSQLIWVAFIQNWWSEPQAVVYVGGPLEKGGQTVLPTAGVAASEVVEKLHVRKIPDTEIDHALLDRLLVLLERAYLSALGPPDVMYCCDLPIWDLNFVDNNKSLRVSHRCHIGARWDE